MASLSSHNKSLVIHILQQMIDSCDYITEWNKDITDPNIYPSSPSGMQVMAATCMLIESIGEEIKKIDRLAPEYLKSQAPETPWKEIKGLRDHIAHGYFNLDADIIFDVAMNEIPQLRPILIELKSILQKT